MNAIRFGFSNIGNTLGQRDARGQFHAFPSAKQFLTPLHETLGLRLGLISTLGDNAKQDIWSLLHDQGLTPFLDFDAFFCERDAGVAKPDPGIYRFAAKEVGVPIDQCLLIDENLLEVIGAMAAGMRAILKPFPPGIEASVD